MKFEAVREISTLQQVFDYIDENGVFAYLDKYQLPIDWRPYAFHNEYVRGTIKVKYPLYKKRIELWEKLHGLPIIKKTILGK